MAWVRFPDGTRRKVERVDKAAAQRDLDELVTLRAQSLDPGPRRERLASFAEVIAAWFKAGCPNVSPSSKSRHARVKSPNTVANAGQMLRTSVLPVIGKQWVDRTSTERLEELFRSMAARGKATSTVDRTWNYLNQALQFGVRQRLTRTPADPRPAMWLTGLMCGLRPGELAGLRWCCVDLDSASPSLEVAERALEIGRKDAGQAAPKTARSRRRIDLHPLLVAALLRHREEQRLLGLHDDEAFVFCTRNGTPMSTSNLRRAFQHLCARAGLGTDWTTYELRHS